MRRNPWTIQRTVPPTSTPITVREIKQNLNLPLSFDHHDPKISDYIHAATDQFESDTDRVCMEQTFEMLIDGFPMGYEEPIDLMKRPVTSVTSFTYHDNDNALQTLDPSIYYLSTARRSITLAHEQKWPDFSAYTESIVITFVCGLPSATQVPRMYRQAISLQVGAWFIDPTDSNQADQWRRAYTNLIQRLLQEKEI